MKRKMNYHEHDTPRQEEFPDISNVASATECTGLMYKSPQDESEYENYQELSLMAIPKKNPQGKKPGEGGPGSSPTPQASSLSYR